MTPSEINRAIVNQPANEVLYPCADCGALRTESEGGKTFTLCDECWDKWVEEKKGEG